MTTQGIRTEYRITIEGWSSEIVTHRDLERETTDEVQRVKGLLREGLVIEESLDIARAQVESSGQTVSVVDRQSDDYWTSQFSWQPSSRTWLTDNMPLGETTMSVDSTDAFAVGDYIHVGTECMRIDAVDSGTQLAVFRAVRGTIEQAHYTEDGESLTRPVVTRARFTSIEGRRCNIYRYTRGVDDLQGDGNIIWRGVCATDAALNEGGTTWSFQVDSILTMLEQDLGGDLELPFGQRGVYYSFNYPLFIRIGEYTSASRGGSEGDAFGLIISGHFETVDDLVSQINVMLPSAIALLPSFEGTLRAIRLSETQWGFNLRTNNDPRWLDISVRPSVRTRDRDSLELITGARTVSALNDFQYLGDTTRFPLGLWGQGEARLIEGFPVGRVVSSQSINDNPNDFFPDGLQVFAVGDTLTMESRTVTLPDGTEGPIVLRVVAADDVNRRYRLESDSVDRFDYSPDDVYQFRRTASYVNGPTNLANFKDALTARAPIDANRGATPFITDQELGAWIPAVRRGVAHAPFFYNRLYQVTQAVELKELLENEARLIGCYFVLQQDGRIGLRYLEMPTATSPSVVDLDGSTNLATDAQISWERNRFGSVNTVNIKTGYDAVNDEHTGPEYRVRDVTAISTRKSTKELQIEPKSGEAYPPDIRTITESSRRVLAIFGRPYTVITVPVPYDVLEVVRTGDIVRISSHRIPDAATGQRGVESLPGLVVGRMWDIGTSEHGTIDVIVNDVTQVGYTPSVSIFGSTSLGGDRYRLDVEMTDPNRVWNLAPPGLTVSDLYEPGFVLDLVEWNTKDGPLQRCTVEAVTDTTLDVLFAGPITIPAQCYMRFAPSTAAVGRQLLYAYVGAANGRIPTASGDIDAKDFAA